MVRKFHFLNVILMMVVMFVCAIACTDEGMETQSFKPAVDRADYANTLKHQIDTAEVGKAYDYMTADFKGYVYSGINCIDSLIRQKHPVMDAVLKVSKTGYNITEDLLNSQVISSDIKRKYEPAVNEVGTYLDKDTVRIELNDGQILTVPVNISTLSVEFQQKRIFCGSDTLLSARLYSVKNLPVSSRAAYVSKTVNTEYTVELTFADKNTSSYQRHLIYLKGYALRYVLSEDDIDKVVVENKNRVVIDATTEKCSFDEVVYMKSGEVNRAEKSIILNRLFKGIDPYDKYVKSFSYAFLKSNGLTSGAESLARTDGNWTVYGRTSKYSADVTNQISAELIVTDYTLYHERTVYKDLFVEVAFDFEDIHVSEVSNRVSDAESDKDGYDKAVFNNAVKASYMTYVHDISEKVNLYKIAKVVNGYDIRDAKLEIKDDKVIASLTFVVEYADGTEELHNETQEFARSLVCTTDWTAKESMTDYTTGDAAVELKSVNTRSDGFWSFSNETRVITTQAKLHSSVQRNSWTAVDPNDIVYKREGRSYAFDKIEFSAIHKGDNVELSGKAGDISIYKYPDNLTVSFGDNNKETTAPGTILVDGKTTTGYEIRDSKLDVKDNSVTASLTFVTKYLDGTEATEAVSKTFPRSLTCNSDWTAREKNASQTTAKPSFVMSGSEQVSDGNWTYLKETKTITAIAALNASSQENSWTSVDPNSIVYTREGISCEFTKLKFDVAYVNSDVQLASKENLVETYKYANDINVLFGDNTVKTAAPGTIIVEKDREVIGREFRDKNIVIDDDNVTASVIFVTKYNDGTEDTEAVSKSFARSLKCYTDWTVNSQNIKPTTLMANANLKDSKNLTDGFWSYDNETYNITTDVNFAGLGGNTQINGWEAVVPNSIVYTRDGVSCEFGKFMLSAKETGSSVDLASQTETEMRYSYKDNVDVTFGSNTVKSSAPGTIINAITIVDYEFRNGSLTVLDGSVKAELVFVTKYSNGTEKTEPVSKIFQRMFTTESNWISTENNANQSTGSANVALLSSDAMTDGFWSFSNETRSITTSAQLNGSTQTNKWKSVDPNSIVYTRSGKTYKFDVLNFSAQEAGASVNVTSDTDEITTYGYTDMINVMFGNNTINGSAPGTINVEKAWTPDFPAEWGKFVSATCTISHNEIKKDWVYSWSIHFEKGTLPVIIRQNDTSATIDTSLFDSDTNSRFNGAAYKNGKWHNAIAQDGDHYMLWTDTNGSVLNTMLHPTASMWHWNHGKQSVFNDDFSFEIGHNGSSLVVKKNGAIFASYKAAK